MKYSTWLNRRVYSDTDRDPDVEPYSIIKMMDFAKLAEMFAL